MAAKTARDLSDEDKNRLAELGDVLRRNGVQEKESSQSNATDTPSHDKQSWSERGKVRDLAIERDGKTEAVNQTQTTWVERLSASRAAQGASKGSNDNAQEVPEQSQEAPAMTRQDRSKRSTAKSEAEATQGVPEQAKPEEQASATPTAGKHKAGWVDREKANQAEGKKPEQGTFAEKRKEQSKESGEEKAVKPRDTPAREKQGKTNEHER